MSALLPLLVGIPALGALVISTRGGRMLRLGPVASAASFVLAGALAVQVASRGEISAAVTGPSGKLVAGLSADRVSALLLPLVCGVSSVVQAFSLRYLNGDGVARSFFVCAGLLTSATAAMITAASLIGLALAWSLSGLALCLLLGLYGGLPAAAQGVRRTATSFLVGDAALWAAVILATVTWGNIDLRTLSAHSSQLAGRHTAVGLVACLLVIAAAARSAQLPLQGWLPSTLAAPTPVSALLHAGVVNGGGILLVRLSPLFGASRLAGTAAFLTGAATLLYGTQLMLVKPDVKGALAHSTMGQMGFMIMTCGIGAFAAVIFHLVAHGMYKATLFLGSGSAVHRSERHAKTPPRVLGAGLRPGSSAALAVATPALGLALAVALLNPALSGVRGSIAMVVFAWATGVRLAWGWLARASSPGRVAAMAGLACAGAIAYVGVLEAVTGFLAPSLAGAGAESASPWLLAPVVGLLAAGALLRWAPSALGELGKDLYVLALGRGHVGRSAPWRPRSLRLPRPATMLAPLAGSQGGRP